MASRISWALQAATGVLVFSGYLALASAQNYGAGMLLIPLVLFPLSPLGAYMESRFLAWRMARTAAAVTYACFIPFSLSLFGLMDAVVALVIFIQIYLLLGRRNERVYHELFLMSFFLLLAAVVQAPEPMIAVALLLHGVGAVWAFALLRMAVGVGEAAGQAIPELHPLRAGARAPRLGNAFDFGLLMSLTVLSLLSLALTVAFFMLTPRVEAGWLGRRDSRQAITGLSETVRISGNTSIYEDQSIVMHVRFPEEPGGVFLPHDLLYWRATTLSRFSGDEWSRRGLQHHYQPGIPESFGRTTRTARYSGGSEEGRRIRPYARLVRQEIFMDDVPTQGIPCLDLPQSIRLLSDTANSRVSWDSGVDFTLQLQARGSRRLQYEAYSDILTPSPEQLRQAPLDYAFMYERDYSLLTYHELLNETLLTARRLTDSHNTPYEKVAALNAWLSGPDFVYTLDVPPLPERNGIDAFVNEIRRGHCELFASALALMTRSLGIPARVVSGYRGGEYSPSDQSYYVRASMAHLWVEVLFKDHGWVRFDPSPRSEVAPSVIRQFRMVLALYSLRGKMFWYQNVIGFEGAPRMDRLWRLLRWRPWQTTPDHAAMIPRAAPESAAPPSQRHFFLLLTHPYAQSAALFIAALGLCLAAWRAKTRSRESYPLNSNQRRARALYKRLRRKAASAGIACGNMTARELIEALRHRLPEDDRQFSAEFIALYNEVRFGGRALTKSQAKPILPRIRALRFKR